MEELSMQELIAARMRNVKPSFVREVLKAAGRKDLISFAGGLPDPNLFDVEGMQQAAQEALAKDPSGALQYGVTDGHMGLRAEIAKLMQSRGAAVDPERIVVTTGSQQGIDLIARTLLDPGDVVLLEQPSYLAALQVFELAQAEMRGVPGDEHGLRVDLLEEEIERLAREGKRAKLIYVVATFANPSGSSLSLERRTALLELAAKHGIMIVEDDPYGELRFRGEVLPSLVGLAENVDGAGELAVYLSTFSKTVAPGLRIGWMVLPEWLHRIVVIAKQASDLHASTFAQHVAYRYLQSGRLVQHLPKIIAAYGERADAMVGALERHLPAGVLRVNAPEGGMFLWGRMADGVDTMQLVNKAIAAGVIFVPGVPFFVRPDANPHLRLSFVTNTPEMIDEGVRRFASVVLD